MLRFSSVTYKTESGKKIFNKLSLHVFKGDVCFVTGGSSSGKTTLIKLACCSLHAAAGLIYSAKIPLFKYKSAPIELRRRISVVSAESLFLNQMSIYENLTIQTSLSVASTENLDQLIELFGLKTILHNNSRAISSFEKGMALTASALMKKPSMLFIDDIGYFFDYENFKKFYKLLLPLSKQGLTVIITAHSMPDFAADAKEIRL